MPPRRLGARPRRLLGEREIAIALNRELASDAVAERLGISVSLVQRIRRTHRAV